MTQHHPTLRRAAAAVAVATLAAAGLALTAAPAVTAGATSCPSIAAQSGGGVPTPGAKKIAVTGITCGKAKTVVRRTNDNVYLMNEVKGPSGWKCKKLSGSRSNAKLRCTKGSARVSWTLVSPPVTGPVN